VLRKTFEPRRNEVTGELRRLHDEELHHLYYSQNIRVIKSRRKRLAGHVKCTWARRYAYLVLVKRGHLEDVDIDGKILTKWIFNKSVRGGAWTGLIWLRIGTGGRLLQSL
jgi:hypothetical protein